MNAEMLLKIRSFVGDVKAEHLENVECFVGEDAAVFIPSTGHCLYSILKDHIHPAYLFYHSFSESISVSCRGKIIPSQRGMLGLIPPFLPHCEIPSDQFTRFIALLIRKDFFEKAGAKYPFIPEQDSISNIPLPEEFLPAIRRFIAEVDAALPGFVDMVKSLEMQIAHMLLRSACDVPTGVLKVSRRSDVDSAVEYINENFSKPILLNDLAEITAMSPSHLSRIFKKETGFAVQEYIIKVRLERSRILLMNGDRKLVEIAHQCGFSSSAHFSSCFSKRYKMTPSRFRGIS